MPHINSMESGTGIQWNSDIGQNSGDGIPPGNIGIFSLFDKATSDLSNRSTSWHGAEKNESENPGDNSIKRNVEHENNFKVEKVWRKCFVILNHIDFNHINTDLNHSNHVDSNHSNPNKLITANQKAINHSDNVC